MLNAVREKWTTVAVATILPGVLAGVIEYVMTQGVSGWVPVVVALIGGLGTVAVLLFMGMPRLSKNPQQIAARNFSPRTPAELVAEIEGKRMTELTAAAVSQRHIGQWLRVNGSIDDIRDWFDSIDVRIKTLEHQTPMTLRFNKNVWLETLKPFNIGDQITAIGKIDSISSISVRLEECELIDPDMAGSS